MQADHSTDSKPIALESSATNVTNNEFLLHVAGGQFKALWVCAFRDSPTADRPSMWAGRPYLTGQTSFTNTKSNTYFATCELVIGRRRLKENFARLLVLVADDGDPTKLLAPPSYVIETSPGNFQIGYILANDSESRDRAHCDRALKAMVKHGLAKADKSGNNVARYVRLPVGCNTKYEGAPAHKLTEWRPELTYTLTQALAAFGVSLDTPAAAAEPAADVASMPRGWDDDSGGRLDVDKAQADIISGAVLHDSLTRLAAHYASRGLGIDEIENILIDLMNQSAARDNDRRARWDTCMSKLRHDTIASAVEKFGSVYSRKIDYTELGNANLLAQLSAGNLRFVAEREIWIVWVGGRWEVDQTGQHAQKAAGLVGEHYSKEVAKLTTQLRGMDSAVAKRHQKTIDVAAAWEKACRSRRGIVNMLALASCHPDLVISVQALDTDPHLLGCQNGVVDLRTGALRPDAREDFVTRRCAHNYVASAMAPRFREFINEVTGAPIEAEVDPDTGLVLQATVGRFVPRAEYADYVQRALGYSCTGLTHEHKLFTVFGEHGSNGKNVLFDTVLQVLGAYGVTSPPSLLLTGKRQDANSTTSSTAALAGVRFTVCSEPPKGSTFDNSVLKALTGERQMAVRENYKNQQQMAVTFHIWLLCNAKPKVEHLEQAVISRVLMLPFDRQWNRPGMVDPDPLLPNADKALEGTLAEESEGVLAWLVEGAAKYFSEGLAPCAAVVDATRAYFRDQRCDPVEMWIAQQTRCSTAEGMQASEAFRQFEAWRVRAESTGVLQGGESPATSTAFGLAMTKHKVLKQKHGAVRYGLKATPDRTKTVVDEFDVLPDAAALAECERWMAEFT